MATQALQVLVVDDNRSAADALGRVLKKRGDDVTVVYDGHSAIERIQTHHPDVVLTDLKMEPVDGMTVLRAARAQRPPVDVIVFTAYGAVDIAVQAMHLGARDFLTKPVTVDQVQQRLDEIRRGTTAQESQSAPSVPFVAEAMATRALLDTIRKAAAAPSPLWIEGEMGSGRGFVAETVHRLTGNTAPFLIRDAGVDQAWPESGTVLLPNVDDLPDDLQRELYRAIKHAPPGVRIAATAGPDGRRLVSEGKLRSEVYYALAVVVIRVPPLRERPEDVVPLLDQALDRFAARYGRPRPVLDPGHARSLALHSWPGNVRELFNLAERAVVMGPSAFDLDILEPAPTGLPTLEAGFDLASYLEGVERRILEEALRKSNGDRAQAGRLLGVERNTLRYKLNKYGLLDR